MNIPNPWTRPRNPTQMSESYDPVAWVQVFQILFSIESTWQNHRAMSGREALANAAALAATAFELFLQSAAPNVHRFGDLDQVWILWTGFMTFKTLRSSNLVQVVGASWTSDKLMLMCCKPASLVIPIPSSFHSYWWRTHSAQLNQLQVKNFHEGMRILQKLTQATWPPHGFVMVEKHADAEIVCHALFFLRDGQQTTATTVSFHGAQWTWQASAKMQLSWGSLDFNGNLKLQTSPCLCQAFPPSLLLLPVLFLFPAPLTPLRRRLLPTLSFVFWILRRFDKATTSAARFSGIYLMFANDCPTHQEGYVHDWCCDWGVAVTCLPRWVPWAMTASCKLEV